MAPLEGRAQGRPEVAVREGGRTVHLFASLDPARPAAALRLDLPPAWRLGRVRLLRYGTDPVPLDVRPDTTGGRVLLRPTAPLRGPHELVLRVRLPDRQGRGRWHYSVLVRPPGRDSAGGAAYRVAERRSFPVRVEPPASPDGPNRALSLRAAARPLRLRARALPALGGDAAFTIEFWMRTNAVDEIVLSTWTGDEATAYPAEFVVDPSGRLRLYTGRPGRHRALRSTRPVADGAWHHVAGVYDAAAPRLRLFVDGERTDSLRARAAAPPIRLLALGGRGAGRGGRPTAADSVRFSGLLDEVRLWGTARSPAQVRRGRSRPTQRPPPAAEAPRVRLGFDAAPGAGADAPLRAWPDGAERVPARLSLRVGLRNLRARSQGRSVTLRWQGPRGDATAFVVERSLDGRSFTPVATVDPAEARRTTRRGAATYAYTDTPGQGAVVYYRIRQRGRTGPPRTSGTIKVGLGRADAATDPVRLIGNFPNPFGETTTVAYEVREAVPVTITVWDLTGHRIATLAKGVRRPGYHETTFDATGLPSGPYFLRLRARDHKQSHRMVVLK
jgi:hypothetical protein